MTALPATITRPVFPAASLSFSALEAAWLATPYGDAFVALAAGAGSAVGNSAAGQNFQLTHNRRGSRSRRSRRGSLIACK